MAPQTRSSVARPSLIAAQGTLGRPQGIQKRKNHCSPKYTRPRKAHPKILGCGNPGEQFEARKQSRLLSIPPELRLLIWEYALTSEEGSLRFDHTTRRFDSSKIAAGLLTTCHSVALETLYLPIRLNTLLFNIKDDSSNVQNSLNFMYRIRDVECKMGCNFKFKGLKLSTDATGN